MSNANRRVTDMKEHVMYDLSEYNTSDEKWSCLHRTLPSLEHFDAEAESGNQNYILHNKRKSITTIVVKKRGVEK